ncbi:MAG: hypothetical protein Q9213_007440 [Squamulea squamosa]
MYQTTRNVAISLLAAFTQAQQLSKPALQPSVDYLNQGLVNNLSPTHSTWDIWGPGYIAQGCKDMTQRAGLNPADVETYNVHYDDCSTAWVICRHKSVTEPLINLIDLFGRLPVHTRQYVRHLIHLPTPSSGGYAYNWNGNVAVHSRVTGDIMWAFIHEAGHSLDLLGAYPDKPLSSSANWINNYNQDPNVPDSYAQTSQVENVAQNTVVDTYNLVVPNGFAGVEPGWQNIFHQFATVQTAQRNAGNLLVPGGTCTSRLTNSAPVLQSSMKRWLQGRALGPPPNVALPHDMKVIPGKEFNTKDICKIHW